MNTSPNQPAASTRRNPKNSSRRWIPYAGGVVLVTLIILGLWPKPAPVELGRVASGALRATVNEEGKTRIRQRFTVSSPVMGQLRRIPFKAGAEVQAGRTVVAVIEPLAPAMLDPRARALAEARRDAAAASLEKNRATHAFAVSELRRFEKLAAEKTISPQELEAAQTREAAGAKDTLGAESLLRQAEAELADFVGAHTNPVTAPREILAPITGRVLRVFEENARVVGAGTPLLELGDPADLEVVVEVLSRDGAAIQPGAKAELDQWGVSGAAPLRATVRLVEPAAFTKVSALGVEEQRVRVILDLLTPPEERRGLGDNFRVETRTVVWEAEQTLKVPAGALFRRGDQWAAFVISEGRARLVMVKAGRSSGTEMQVVEGLTAGQPIILYPGGRVHEGQRVREIQM